MALFKIFKGKKETLPATLHDGYCYVTIDEQKMYVDYKESPQDETVKRLTLNANTSDNLGFLGQENQKIILIKDQTYGTSFPTENLVDGQLFFKDISEDTSYLTSSQIQNLSERLEETQEN